MSVVRRQLLRHPQFPADAVERIDVAVTRQASDLAVTFALRGRLPELRIPAAGTTLFGDRLWAHTCCEIFVGRVGAVAYAEWNFSPSGQVAQFDFTDYRQRGPSTVNAACTVKTRRDDTSLVLNATLTLPVAFTGPLQLGIATVVEDAHGALSYWALEHAPDRPDFHDRGTFVLPLPAGAS